MTALVTPIEQEGALRWVVVMVILFAPTVFRAETKEVVGQTKIPLHVICRDRLISFICLFAHCTYRSGRLSW
jgi:hypothetical protein